MQSAATNANRWALVPRPAEGSMKNYKEYCKCHETAIILYSGKDEFCPACKLPRLWWFSVVKGKEKFVAMQKNTPFTCENPDPIREPGIVYFEFGDTSENAFAKLRAQQSVQRMGLLARISKWFGAIAHR